MCPDFNSGSDHWAYETKDLPFNVCQAFNDAIDVACVAENEARNSGNPRNYLGVSEIGQECERQVQYAYQKTEKDADKHFNGITLRKFAGGHYFEDHTADLMKGAGFDLKTHKANGGQFGFALFDDQFKGHIDGVIVGGPDWLKVPCLWEHKNLGNKSFNKHKSKPLEEANPVYAAQVALYQCHLQLTEYPAVFCARNSDTQEIYWEMVEYDAELAQEMTERAYRIITDTKADYQYPRSFNSPDFFKCKWCAYQKRCWDD